MRSFCIYAGIVLIAACADVSAQDAATIYQESKDSIVLIISHDSNQTPLGMGSGFYFRPGLIATNYHVIDGAKSFLIKNVGSNQEFQDATVKSYSERLDIAILSTGVEGQALPLSTATSDVGDQVVVIGNPRGLEGSVSTGIVSGIRSAGEFSAYQITAPISPGSSGGPVFNIEGAVIGIATFTLQDSQNLNFAMPVSLLVTLESKSMAWEPPSAPKIMQVKRGNAGIYISNFSKKGSEFWETFSVGNENNYSVENISGILIYISVPATRNESGLPIDFVLFSLKELIPPGLAKRVRRRSFDQDQNWSYVYETGYLEDRYKQFTVELRILNYDIVDQNNSDIFDTILN